MTLLYHGWFLAFFMFAFTSSYIHTSSNRYYMHNYHIHHGHINKNGYDSQPLFLVIIIFIFDSYISWQIACPSLFCVWVAGSINIQLLNIMMDCLSFFLVCLSSLNLLDMHLHLIFLSINIINEYIKSQDRHIISKIKLIVVLALNS